MKWIERFDLFLFDLDGLLVDTERLHFEAYRILCSRYGYTLDWDLNQYFKIAHSSAKGLREVLSPHLKGDWDSLYAEKKKIYLDLLQGGELKLMPGVEELLKELARASTKRCVVTHSPKEQIEAIKHALPLLKTIPVWITREDYEDPKPAPDAYLKAIELLADPGDQMIGFEDSLRGIRALQGTVAMPVLICDSTHPQMEEEVLKGIAHYHSFEKIPRTFRGK